MLPIQGYQVYLPVAPILPVFRCDAFTAQVSLQLLSADILEHEGHVGIDEMILQILHGRVVLHPDYGVPVGIDETEPESEEVIGYYVLAVPALLRSLLGDGYRSLQHPYLDESLQIRQDLLGRGLNGTGQLLHGAMPSGYGLEIGVVARQIPEFRSEEVLSFVEKRGAHIHGQSDDVIDGFVVAHQAHIVWYTACHSVSLHRPPVIFGDGRPEREGQYRQIQGVPSV